MNDENILVTEKIGHRPKGQKDLVPRKKRTDFQEIVEPGDNGMITAFSLNLMKQPKIDTNNRKDVEDRIYWYFDECIRNDIRPGVAGLCLALNISRNTWYRWGAEDRHGYQDIVVRSRAMMESILEQYMLKNKINVAAGIFLLKNHFGYRDQTDHLFATEVRDPLGRTTSTEELKRRYLEQQKPTVIVDENDADDYSDTDLQSE